MNFEITLSSEIFSANATLKAFDSFMNTSNTSNMDTKLGSFSKCFMADVALEVLDVLMNCFQVTIEMMIHCKSFVANLALEILDVLMNCFQVSLESTVCCESFVAHLALEIFDVFMNQVVAVDQERLSGISFGSS